MEAVDVRGKFVWHQLMTRDVPGAKSFYSRLVGWKTMPWPLDPAYTVCHADAGPVAGIMQIPSDLPSEVPSHWLQYIGTRDVDSTAQAAVLSAFTIDERTRPICDGSWLPPRRCPAAGVVVAPLVSSALRHIRGPAM